jgi:hypothetical protein
MPIKDSIMESDLRAEISALRREIAELKLMVLPKSQYWELPKLSIQPGSGLQQSKLNYGPSPIRDRQT